jgi:hypothetical protein
VDADDAVLRSSVLRSAVPVAVRHHRVHRRRIMTVEPMVEEDELAQRVADWHDPRVHAAWERWTALPELERYSVGRVLHELRLGGLLQWTPLPADWRVIDAALRVAEEIVARRSTVVMTEVPR